MNIRMYSGDIIVLYPNTIRMLKTWSNGRLVKFFRAYIEARETGEEVLCGDDSVDPILLQIYEVERFSARKRGGQPGNKNAKNKKRIGNESGDESKNEETASLYKDIDKDIYSEREKKETNERANRLLPFLNGMMVEEKKKFFWEDCLRFKEKYDIEMIRAFFVYWSCADARGSLKIEDDQYWDTGAKLMSWARKEKSA